VARALACGCLEDSDVGTGRRVPDGNLFDAGASQHSKLAKESGLPDLPKVRGSETARRTIVLTKLMGVALSRREREERILEPKGGWAGTSSTDLFFLAEKLYGQAKSEAESLDGNTSSYVWAALPILLSGLSATLVEQEAMLANQRQEERVQVLIDTAYLPEQFNRLYRVSGELIEDLKILVELRNEIIHPAHMATGTPDNWPETLRAFKQRGLLSSTGDPTSDYLMLEQMKSLRLLEWAFEVVGRLRSVVLRHHGQPAMQQTGG
jgi:hypothetical protein